MNVVTLRLVTVVLVVWWLGIAWAGDTDSEGVIRGSKVAKLDTLTGSRGDRVVSLRRYNSVVFPKSEYLTAEEAEDAELKREEEDRVSVSGLRPSKTKRKNPFLQDESSDKHEGIDVDSYEHGSKVILGALTKKDMIKYSKSLDLAAYLSSEVQIMLRLRTIDFATFENSFTPNWDLAKDIGFAVVGAGMGTMSMLGSLGVDIGMRYSDFQAIDSMYSTQDLFNTIMSSANEYAAYVDGRTRMIVENGGRAPMLVFTDTPMGNLYTAYTEVFDMVKDPELTASFIKEEMNRLAEESTSDGQVAACKANSKMNTLGGKVARGVGHIGLGILDCMTGGFTIPMHAALTAVEIAGDTTTKVLRMTLEKKKLKMLLLGVYLLEREVWGQLRSDGSGDESSESVFQFCSITDHSKPNFGCGDNHYCQRTFLFNPRDPLRFFEAERSPNGFCSPRKSHHSLADGSSCLDDSDCSSSFCKFAEAIIPNSSRDLEPQMTGQGLIEDPEGHIKVASAFNGISPPDKEPGDEALPDWTSDLNSRWVKVGLEAPRWAEQPGLPMGMDRAVIKGKCASAVPECDERCLDVKGPLAFKVIDPDFDSGDAIARLAAVQRKESKFIADTYGVEIPVARPRGSSRPGASDSISDDGNKESEQEDEF